MKQNTTYEIPDTTHNTKLTINRCRIPLWMTSLICLLILASCSERQLNTPTTQMDIEPQFWVRVLLFDDITECSLAADSSFTVLDAQTQTPLVHFEKPDTSVKINISAGKITIANRPVADNHMIILPDTPHIFNLNGRDYRGKLKLIINADGKSFDAINLVPIESYLAGVVGAEMSSYWEPDALKAQAVAARTYCLYYKKRFGVKRNWDVGKTQATQVYLGVAAESAQVWEAVNKTKGQVLTCRHSDGTQDIFPTYYSSTCGGHTEDSTNVFGGDSFKPLTGVPCPYCKYVAKPKFFFWPMVKFNKTDTSEKLIKKYPTLKKLGKIINITPAGKRDYGNFSRLTKVKLHGSTGKNDSVFAEDLRLTIDPSGYKLRSTIFQIISIGDNWAFTSGRGFGHGVGLCQCGAQAMARRGENANQILSYYYPDSKIIRLY